MANSDHRWTVPNGSIVVVVIVVIRSLFVIRRRFVFTTLRPPAGHFPHTPTRYTTDEVSQNLQAATANFWKIIVAYTFVVGCSGGGAGLEAMPLPCCVLSSSGWVE